MMCLTVSYRPTFFGCFLQLERWLVLAIILCIGEHVSAQQQQLILLAAQNGESITLAIDSAKLSRTTDGQIGLYMRWQLVGQLPTEQRIHLLPRLCTDTDTVSFAPIAVYGTWAYYHALRAGRDDMPGALQYRSREAVEGQTYAQTAPYQPWMADAKLKIAALRTDGCQTQVNDEDHTALEPVTVYHHSQAEAWFDVDTEHVNGTAYIVFPVNRTEVLPDLGNNRKELDQLCHVIDSVRKAEDVVLNRVSIKGFASPEGSYANNERLARERTASVGQYVTQKCGLSTALINTSFEPEDWQGLRDFVAKSQLKERDSLLAIIDSPLEPDPKLARIAKTFPATYKMLLSDVFPRLRHTDYEIDYTLRRLTEHKGALLVDSTRALAIDSLPDPMLLTPTTRRIDPFRPVLAVKTNLLMDLLLAPNIEVEVPIGRRQRWSIMAEYWNPWYRWDKKNQSYEIQLGGLELRRWLLPRCDGSRPYLTGHFAGIYAAVAKFDMERNQVGNQGEIISGGLTYGFAWPIARRWNLEASVSAGAVVGRRRHYNAQFESTHLIYKYTKHLFYAGPTKLKLALTYLLGKKGGGK